ncbi:kinase [Cuniculiplasma sp. SKW3]|uniref:GHMP family kinase ATP-binding protein n=1 Tax=Cuniculiplasma sp. SKW3 TaxID=3400170 RepID=UPI003FD3E7B7
MNDAGFRIVTSRTPLRITFTGGGTDLPEYYRNYGPGAVVSATVDRYIYVTIAKNFRSDEIRVSYSKTENAIKNVNDIQHPTVREALKLLNIDTGIQIISITEIPSGGTGLGSSSSFLVGLLNALHTWEGETVSPKKIAEEAVDIERNILSEPGGKQDQYISAFGGIQLMEFFPDNNVNLSRIPLRGEDLDRLNERLMIFYTGIERKSATIHKSQSKQVSEMVNEYSRMRDLAYETYNSLKEKKFDRLGELMHENWLIKRKLTTGITDDIIDKYYEKAMQAGAEGGKLMGAGGGGFLIFSAPLEYHDKIEKAMNGLVRHRFKIENLGSRIVYLE